MNQAIRLLSDDTIAGISAGEVIERPASVVKELVENAIDSGATRIRIDLEGAGMKVIRVSDNGHGIPPAEVPLALSRHATSKLRALDDLLRVGTFGFRGEALAAITAAGEVEMLTRVPESVEGTHAKTGRDGAIELKPAGCEIGTSVTVRRLFGKLPARLKFLKSPSAETAAVARVVEPYALTHLDVHFVMTIDGEERLNAPTEKDEKVRVMAVLGNPDVSLIAFDHAEGGLRAHGFAETPGSIRKRGKQWLQVNRRPVEDRSLRHALMSSYEGQMPRDTQPFAVIFMTVPSNQVDINVHPTKAEVRFADPKAAYRCLHAALKMAFESVLPSNVGLSPATGDAGPMLAGGGMDPILTLAGDQTLAGWASSPATSGESTSVLAQIYRTYIIARSQSGLLMIDQHTAHEKIIYERLQARERSDVSQGLLVARTMELSSSEFAMISANAEALNRLGIEFDVFGGNSIVIRSVPEQANDRDVEELLRWLIEDLEAAGRSPSPQELEKKLLSTMACHLAVKSGDRLEKMEMEGIVRELMGLKDPLTCPHGRPTYVLYEEGDLAKLFRRTWGLGKRECH